MPAWRSATRVLILFLSAHAAAMCCARAEDALDRQLSQCWSCHGSAGRSSDSTMPVIWGQNAAYLAKQLSDYRDGGRDSQIMSSMAEEIPRARIAEAAERIAARNWPDATERRGATPLSALAQSCAACHGADLKGGLAGQDPAPRLVGQNERYLAEQMQAFASEQRANHAAMTEIMRDIDATQRDALARELAHDAP